MSNLSGQPVPQNDLPDSLKGQEVPDSDLPQGAGPAAGAGGSPSTSAPGASTPPSAGPSLSEKIFGKPGPETQEFGDLGKAVGRGLLEGAVGGFTFVPDLVAGTYNRMEEHGMGGVAGMMGLKHIPEMGAIAQKWIDRTISPPTQGIDKAAEVVSSMVGGGGLVRGGEKLAGSEAGKVASRVTEERSGLAKEIHALGGKISPGYIGGGITKGLQSMGGEPRTYENAAKTNADVADRLVKATLGVQPEEGLNESTFQRLKDEAYKAYRSIGQNLGMIPHDDTYFQDVRRAGERNERSIGAGMNQGQPYGSGELLTRAEQERARYAQPRETGVSAQEMLDKIRSLRYQARMNLKTYNPDNNMLGRTQWDIATAMEDQLQRTADQVAKDSGNPYLADLVPDMKQARQQLARINAVELSMGAGGHIRASDLAGLLDRGSPLDGGLLKVAQFASEFPKDWAPVAERGEHGVFSAVDYLLGGSGIIFHHPAEAALGFARPVARAALMSKPVQESMVRGASGEGKKFSKAVKAGAVAGAGQSQESGDDGQ